MRIVTFSTFWNPFWIIPELKLRELKKDFPEIAVDSLHSADDLAPALKDADIFLGYRLQPQELAAANRLKWIHVPAANVYGFDTQMLREKNIILTNSRGQHAGPIAEHVIGFMLVFSRRFLDSWRYQEEHHYGQLEILNNGPPLYELRGKTIVILGLGAIGKEIARIAKAFGMRVIGIKRHVQNQSLENVDQVVPHTGLRKALSEGDFLVISAARTEETEGMLGTDELALLKKECVIINIARAQIIQEQPLYKILKEGKIRGAALDVFYQEPLPADSPLFKLPNVFLTPHLAGVNSIEHWDRLMKLFRENLRRFLNGKPLLNRVDLSTGY